jgi:hypothetical protein
MFVVVRMERASCHHSIASNLELTTTFLENLYIPGVCVCACVRARFWRELRHEGNYE